MTHWEFLNEVVGRNVVEYVIQPYLADKEDTRRAMKAVVSDLNDLFLHHSVFHSPRRETLAERYAYMNRWYSKRSLKAYLNAPRGCIRRDYARTKVELDLKIQEAEKPLEGRYITKKRAAARRKYIHRLKLERDAHILVS
jgi:hypothetical protein